MRPLGFRELPPKRSSLRSRRRRSRMFITLAIAVLILGAAYAVRYASYLPRFSIQHIEIAGAKDVGTEPVSTFVASKLVSDSFAFFSPSNIFLYPRKSIEEAIKKDFPRIKDVSISRESLLATAITVSIEERKAFARWCGNGTCFALDESGFIFAAASTTLNVATAYVFEGPLAASEPLGQTYLPGSFVGITALLERLGQAGFSPQKIRTDGEQDFSIDLSHGFTIHASFGTDVGLIVKNLELVLSSDALRGKEGDIEYIDLRFGNRVYYKLKGGEQQSVQ